MDENRNQPGFEEKLQLVQEMIAKIENGTLSLEDSVLQYEKGMKMLGELTDYRPARREGDRN